MRSALALASLAVLCSGCLAPVHVAKRYPTTYAEMNDTDAPEILRECFLPSADAGGIFDFGAGSGPLSLHSALGEGTWVTPDDRNDVEVTPHQIKVRAFKTQFPRVLQIGRDQPIRLRLPAVSSYYDQTWRIDDIDQILVVPCQHGAMKDRVRLAGDYLLTDNWPDAIHLPKGKWAIGLWWTRGGDKYRYIRFAVTEANLERALVAIAKLAPRAKISQSL